MPQKIDRRRFIKGSLWATAGGALSLRAAPAAAEAAAAEPVQITPRGDGCPQGRIGTLSISRLIIGSNLISYYIHSRDLNFVNHLARHYNTEAKILDTLAMAESHGINTIMTQADERCLGLMRKYSRERGGRLQWIVAPEITGKPDADRDTIRRLADQGVVAMYLHGERADTFCFHRKQDVIARSLEMIKQQDMPAGVAGHDLNVVRFCEVRKVGADFYVKTFHHHQYPTAPQPAQATAVTSEIPGYWCKDPVETAAVLRGVSKPWIAFKVMAAGAIPPADAFDYAFKRGADFILAGMFDFEIAEDVDLARAAVAAAARRERPWCG